MAIKYGITTGHSITKFLEYSPFAGKHPRLMRKGTKTAAAEAAVAAAEVTAAVDLEEANRIAIRGLGRRRPHHGACLGGRTRWPLRECWLTHARLRV